MKILLISISLFHNCQTIIAIKTIWQKFPIKIGISSNFSIEKITFNNKVSMS